MNTKKLEALNRGVVAENFVAEKLLELGWKIRCRNYRIKAGEIDLIAADQDCLAFVEVRSRDESTLIHPLESILFSKQKRIVFAARYYMQRQKDLPHFREIRFDVASVFFGKNLELEYYKAAFLPGE